MNLDAIRWRKNTKGRGELIAVLGKGFPSCGYRNVTKDLVSGILLIYHELGGAFMFGQRRVPSCNLMGFEMSDVSSNASLG